VIATACSAKAQVSCSPPLALERPSTQISSSETTTTGNELSGITLHSHAPGDDLNGNKLVGNWLRRDNVGGDPDAHDARTTGILIFSVAARLSGIVVRGNRIADTYYGIWTQNVPTIPSRANRFLDVAVPVYQR
jgi:hypothetical protein